MSGIITKVSGPLVVAEGLADANVSDVVRVGSQRLIGEILNMTGDSRPSRSMRRPRASALAPRSSPRGSALSVELGPGMLENIYDGIQRPLPEIRALTGETITRGVQVAALNRQKKWDFVPSPSRPARRRGRRPRHRPGDQRHPPQDHGAPGQRDGQVHRKGRVHSGPRRRRPRGLQRQDP